MTVNELVLQIVKMTPADQFDLAFKVAENIGYVLTKEPSEVKQPEPAAFWFQSPATSTKPA